MFKSELFAGTGTLNVLTTVPEPAPLSLGVVALLGLAVLVRRRPIDG